MLLAPYRCDLDFFPRLHPAIADLVTVEMVSLTLVLVLVFGFALGSVLGLACYVVIVGTCPCRRTRLGRSGLGGGLHDLGDYRAWLRRRGFVVGGEEGGEGG